MGAPADRHIKNFARQLDRYGRQVTVDGRVMLGIFTPVDSASFDLVPGGLEIDDASPTHYVSVSAAHFDLSSDNPQGLQLSDEHGDHWKITATTHEPGDPELRLFLAPDE